MKAVMLSTQPEWCVEILGLRKSLEVRRNCPKLKTPFKVYIYCTKGKKNILWNSTALMKPYRYIDDHSYNGTDRSMNGTVIGEFTCDSIIRLYPVSTTRNGLIRYEGLSEIGLKQTRLTQEQLCEYGNWKYLYCWHISNLVIYDKPKELSKFVCKSSVFKFDENGSVVLTGMKRPPQSWCYVEELEG